MRLPGWIDISLKNPLGCETSFGYSQYSVGDGKTYATRRLLRVFAGREWSYGGLTAEYNRSWSFESLLIQVIHVQGDARCGGTPLREW